jgi:hypothetical protein
MGARARRTPEPNDPIGARSEAASATARETSKPRHEQAFGCPGEQREPPTRGLGSRTVLALACRCGAGDTRGHNQPRVQRTCWHPIVPPHDEIACTVEQLDVDPGGRGRSRLSEPRTRHKPPSVAWRCREVESRVAATVRCGARSGTTDSNERAVGRRVKPAAAGCWSRGETAVPTCAPVARPTRAPSQRRRRRTHLALSASDAPRAIESRRTGLKRTQGFYAAFDR